MNNTMKSAPQRQAYRHPFFRNSFPSIFDDVFFGKEHAAHVPPVNIAEDEKSWHIEVSAPGFSKEEFSIGLENDTLTVSATHKAKEGQEKNYSRREFRTGDFTRSFRLPKEKVNEESISAAYENGVLHIGIPKKQEEPKPGPKAITVA